MEQIQCNKSQCIHQFFRWYTFLVSISRVASVSASAGVLVAASFFLCLCFPTVWENINHTLKCKWTSYPIYFSWIRNFFSTVVKYLLWLFNHMCSSSNIATLFLSCLFLKTMNSISLEIKWLKCKTPFLNVTMSEDFLWNNQNVIVKVKKPLTWR